MFKSFKTALGAEKIESLESRVLAASEAGDEQAGWESLKPLLRAQRHQPEAAECLLRIVGGSHLSIDNSLTVLSDIYEAHADNPAVVATIGGCLEKARDIDFLNASPPDYRLFTDVIETLADLANGSLAGDTEWSVLDGLATASRMVARQRDDLAETSYKRLVDLDPEYAPAHYNLGLFYKTRGRFREGMLANQAAARLVDEPVESYEWNLGICATGAGEGAIALQVWKRMGQVIEMGRFDLPEGGYPQCKVRLAQRPLAERNSDNDDPGLEETIWIQRLSPCHGIVRSVLYQDLGVDFGDVVLMDGAPITYHTYGEQEVPVFPHLATLLKRSYQIFDFAGTQNEPGQLASASEDLTADAIVYSHTENYQTICANCWRDPDIDHEDHLEEQKHVVTGRIAAPPDVSPEQLLGELDQAVAGRPPCSIYVPALCAAAGYDERADVERRRFGILANN